MSYMIKAVLSNPKLPENGVASIPFPLSRAEYDHSISEVLAPMGIGSAVTQDCMVEEIDSPYEVLQCIRWQAVNVDELDYLARRLESFDEYEVKQFQAACSAFLCLSMKDLINMTFCCQGTTVISDLSKLEEAGKAHYLAIHGGAAPVDEMKSVDGRALAQELIKSGKGKLTPYGLFFQNGVLLEELYEGHSFPPFPRVDQQAELELTKPDGTKSVIYLPFAESEWDRFLQRENIPDAHECKQALYLYLGQGECIVLDGDVAELEEWNKLCDTISIMPHHRQQAFAAALEVTGAEDLSQMQLLVSSLGDFDLIPGIKDVESYGKYMIQKSGKYDYDESLDCYYNYEALGEFLLTHEVGQFTSQGYLKCEEGSAFLDFFTQESPEVGQTQGHQTMQMGGM